MADRNIPWVPVAAMVVGGGVLAWIVAAIAGRPATASALPAYVQPPRQPSQPALSESDTSVVQPSETISRPLQPFVPVTFSEGGHTVTLNVAEDYLLPMPVLQAQRIADENFAILPTKKIVDKIHEAASLKLPFHAMDPEHEGVSRGSEEMLRRFLAKIDQDRAGRTGLASGQFKDYVISTTMRPGKMVIYGGHYRDGSLVQSLSGPWHDIGYVDYSQGTRLVSRFLIIDDQTMSIEDVLRDPALHSLLSDEGIVRQTRYT